MPRWAAAVALATAALLAATPQVRAGVADVLGLGGVEVRSGPAPWAPPPASHPALPGETVTTLDEARRLAAFPVRLPRLLGAPDRVVVSDGRPPRVVSLIYRPGPHRPMQGPVEVRLDEFDGRIGPLFGKYLTDGTGAERIAVAGGVGIWVGGPHQVFYLDRNGDFRVESARLSQPTLIWEAGGVTLRLEGAFSRADAVAIAASLA
jgi:hypothetical protein